MGINYYVEPKPPCSACGRGHERLHIGKSSIGWVFALHAIPDLRLDSWAHWQAYLLEGERNGERRIYDEYGGEITLDQLRQIVTERKGNPNMWTRIGLLSNGAELHEPSGLARVNLKRLPPERFAQTRHGEGTWTMFEGDFS